MLKERPTGASIVIFNIVAFILHAIIGSTLKYVKTTCYNYYVIFNSTAI